MASIYKQLTSNDVVSTRTLLHEAIPITGSIVSGTYIEADDAISVKDYAHGMFQSVYDYPYLSSSANHLFDITLGFANSSDLSASTTFQTAKKINIYNQMAQVLVGYDKTGSVRLFDADGDFFGTTTDKMKECVFLNFSRLLYKDEVKKGSFECELGVFSGSSFTGQTFERRIKITDASGSDSYLVNSPVGEYGILYATSSHQGKAVLKGNRYYSVGLIYYQAGIVVLTGSIFNTATQGGFLNNSNGGSSMGTALSSACAFGHDGFRHTTASSITASANGLRNRIYNIQFNNTVELNSSIYFCRANHNEFNYSSNPTYLSGSTIRVKTNSVDNPVSYITTIGLYSADNQLLAVGKLSEPLKKDPTIELTLRTRLDY